MKLMKKPSEPKVPEEFFEVEESIWLDFYRQEKYTLKDIEKLLPEGSTLDNLIIREEIGYDGEPDQVQFLVKKLKKNTQYEKEMEVYQKKLKKFEADMKLWEGEANLREIARKEKDAAQKQLEMKIAEKEFKAAKKRLENLKKSRGSSI